MLCTILHAFWGRGGGQITKFFCVYCVLIVSEGDTAARRRRERQGCRASCVHDPSQASGS